MDCVHALAVAKRLIYVQGSLLWLTWYKSGIFPHSTKSVGRKNHQAIAYGFKLEMLNWFLFKIFKFFSTDNNI